MVSVVSWCIIRLSNGDKKEDKDGGDDEEGPRDLSTSGGLPDISLVSAENYQKVLESLKGKLKQLQEEQHQSNGLTKAEKLTCNICMVSQHVAEKIQPFSFF